MNTAIANTARTCQPWCILHDPESDICHGSAVDLDFSAGRRSVDTAKYADVSLTYCEEEGTSLWLDIARVGSAHFEVDHARRLAETILEKVRQAEAALIPGPRSGTEDGAR